MERRPGAEAAELGFFNEVFTAKVCWRNCFSEEKTYFERLNERWQNNKFLARTVLFFVVLSAALTLYEKFSVLLTDTENPNQDPGSVVARDLVQTSSVDVKVGHYDATINLIIDQNCDASGEIDFTYRLDGSKLETEDVWGDLECRTLTINRDPPGGTCSGLLSPAGDTLTCTWNGLAAELEFGPSLSSCGC